MIAKTLAIAEDTRSISFSDLTILINRTAKYYHRHGIKVKDYVALLGYNSIEYVIAIYSLWKLGAVPVPINTRLNDDEITKIILSSNCSCIIKDDFFENRLPDFPSVKMLIKFEGDECKIDISSKPNDAAVIIHTSGSSGIPKGVITTNNNLFQSYLAATSFFKFSSNDVFLASLPFYHIGGFAIINRALLSGGILVLPKSLKQDDIVKSMQKHDPTVVSLVPTMLKRMMDAGNKPNKKLRILFLGGGPSSDELIYSALNNNWPIVKVYGSSETTAMVTACMGENLKLNPASAGKPFDNIEIKILDDNKNPVANKTVGEIAVKSHAIAKGYLNNQKLWEAKIHNGFYLTGDYGYIDNNGNLFVVARRTDLIVSGGENINPHEVEFALLEHPQIKEAIVFPYESSEWGQIPVAAIVSKKDKSLTNEDVKLFLKSKIASYKVPKKYLFLDTIPRTELGKIEIKKLKNMIN